MPEFFFVSKRNGVLGFRGLKGLPSRKPSNPGIDWIGN